MAAISTDESTTLLEPSGGCLLFAAALTLAAVMVTMTGVMLVGVMH